MGRIDAAYDPVIGRRVALKSLHSELREEAQAVAKFAEEARITGQLEHPNVVPIYDLAESASEPFIVMRLVQGKSLTQLLAHTETPTTSTEATDLLQHFIEIVLRLCDALSFAHSRGVVHCDVKPDNIMVGEHGQVYLMDWGVALTARSREAFTGTVAYMAPEQLLGRVDDIDERTDVFGLGGVLHEIMTGKPPNDGYPAMTAAYTTRRRTLEPHRLWTRLPPELCRISAKALAPKREDRYPNVSALRADLERFTRGGGWFDSLTAEPGESIVTEGEPGDTAYIVESGVCEVWKNMQGRRTLIRRLGPGDVFGEAAVFTGGPRTASVVAVDRVSLKVITGDSLNRELDRNPILAGFVRSLATLFRETDAALSGRGNEGSERGPSR
jgi:eukaryotic-like serine/threonine-protein kinase